MKSETVPPGVMVPPNFPREDLVARLLLPPLAQTLCRRELGLLASRTYVHSLTLLYIETVCCFW
jgi:hypothetical protein